MTSNIDLELQIAEAEMRKEELNLRILKLKQQKALQEPSGSNVSPLATPPAQAAVGPIRNPPVPVTVGLKERYYVIFNGAHKGIYKSWMEISPFITAKPDIRHQSYSTRIEAEGALANSESFQLPPRPVSAMDYALTLSKPQKQPRRMTTLGTIPQVTFYDPTIFNQEQKELQFINKNQFLTLLNTIRQDDGTAMNSNHYYSTDRDDMLGSKYNFIQESDPKMVYQAFMAGLVENIYPSPDHKELEYFPTNFKRAIKTFAQKVSGERPIYIKSTSSYVDWDEDESPLPSYHLVKIGLVGASRTVPKPKVLKPAEFGPVIIEARAQMLSQILTETRRFNRNTEVKVNYSTNHVLIFSQSNRKISEDGKRKVANFEAQFAGNLLAISAQTKLMYEVIADDMLIKKETDVTMTEAMTEAADKGKEILEDEDLVALSIKSDN